MTSLNGTTDGFNSGHPRRLYITTSAYHNDIYRYTTSRSTTTYVVSGTLTSLATLGTGTATNCPANRILRENGRRLNKDANPGLSTLLVGVYDSVSGLSGFIDPNSPRFAVYNGDKSVFQDNGVDPNGGALDQGPPIFTRGTVTGSGLTAATTSGSTTTTFFNASSTGVTISAGGVTQKVITLSTGAQNLDLSLGNVFYLPIANALTAVTYTLTNATVGSTFYFIGASTSAVALTFAGATTIAIAATQGGATTGFVGNNSVYTTPSVATRNLITGVVVVA
jgi:hypothetical protein